MFRAAALIVAIFELQRAGLLIRYNHLAVDIPFLTLLKSFIVGFRFDLSITGYILAPVAIFGSIPGIGLESSKITRNITSVYLTLITGIAVLMGFIDLYFFGEFNTRLNHLALEWADTPGIVMSMLWKWFPVIPFTLIWIAFLTLLFLVNHYLLKWSFSNVKPTSPLFRLIVVLPLALGLTFLAIRGRVSIKAPLTWGLAYFSNHDFANQLALNSSFTFIRDSFIDHPQRQAEEKSIAYMPIEEAMLKVQQALKIEKGQLLPGSLIARVEEDTDSVRNLNVIVLLMESLTSRFISSCGGTEDLAPEFDRLASNSALFTNFYSSGFHTYTGIFSTVTGLPVLQGKSVMKRTEGRQEFSGLASVLKKRGYKTVFFVTHDPHFDNMKGFLTINDFDRIISQDDYPAGTAVSSLGVPDEVMYDRAIDELNNIEKPFLAVILTGSAHGPFIHPDRPYPHTPLDHPYADRFNAFSYADWAMGRFYDEIQSFYWGDNTLIAITGDHGVPWEPVIGMDLSQFSVPFLLTGNDCVKNGIYRNLGGQKDITATIMDVLGGKWVNNTLGTSLLSNNTGFAMFIEGGSVGLIEGNSYYIRERDVRTSLYKLPGMSLIENNSEAISDRLLLADAFLSATHNMIMNRLVSPPE